jgi:hypothetical protein
VVGSTVLAPSHRLRSRRAGHRNPRGQLVNGGAVRPAGATLAAVARREHVDLVPPWNRRLGLARCRGQNHTSCEKSSWPDLDYATSGGDLIQETASIRHIYIPRRRIVNRAGESGRRGGVHPHGPLSRRAHFRGRSTEYWMVPMEPAVRYLPHRRCLAHSRRRRRSWCLLRTRRSGVHGAGAWSCRGGRRRCR